MEKDESMEQNKNNFSFKFTIKTFQHGPKCPDFYKSMNLKFQFLK